MAVAPGMIFSVSPNFTTTYSVVGSNTAGCTGTGTVKVNPTPKIQISISPASSCIGEPVTLQAMGATSYTWTGGLGNSPLITVTPNTTTNYTVTGSTTGCSATASITAKVQECTGIPSQSAHLDILVFPNPAARFVKIQAASRITAVEILDLNGRVLERTYPNDHQAEIDLGMNLGFYFLRIQTVTSPFLGQLAIIQSQI